MHTESMEQILIKMLNLTRYRDSLKNNRKVIKNSMYYTVFKDEESRENKIRHYSKRIKLVKYALKQMKKEL